MKITFDFDPITVPTDMRQCDYTGCTRLAGCILDGRLMCAVHAGPVWDKAQQERPEHKEFMRKLLNGEDV